MCAMALGLVVGVPSLELMERILLQERDGKRAFIADPISVDADHTITKDELVAYLSAHSEVSAVPEVVDALEASTPDAAKALSITLAPHEPSRETKRLNETADTVFFIGEIPQGKIFQRIDPTRDDANDIYSRWTTLLKEADPTRQETLYAELKTKVSQMYVLHRDGTVRLVDQSTTFKTIGSLKALPVAALPAESFDRYTQPGQTLDLTEAITDFVSLTTDDAGNLTFTPLRDYLPGYDGEPPYAMVAFSESERERLAFLFPLSFPNVPPPPTERCDDNADKDGDGKTDCEDPLCTNQLNCASQPQANAAEGETGEKLQAAAAFNEPEPAEGVVNNSGEESTDIPTEIPIEAPTDVPTEAPREAPTDQPTDIQTEVPTEIPTEAPTDAPTEMPTDVPTDLPTEIPTEAPTEIPTEVPTGAPTEVPTGVPTDPPTDIPTEVPTDIPTQAPTDVPTEVPTEAPTDLPTDIPTEVPTDAPTEGPTNVPTEPPTEAPTIVPTELPTQPPTEAPTDVPTEVPTAVPTDLPTEAPTTIPTDGPTDTPTAVPTDVPTEVPSETPTVLTTETPTQPPTETPTELPTESPTPKTCGNSQLDSKEECDESSSQYGDAYCKQIKESDRFTCDSCQCVEDACGNRQLDSNEQCDGSSSQYGDSYCKKIKESDRFTCDSCECVEDPCGNKRLDAEEECDASTSKYGDAYCKKIKESDRFTCDTCECVQDPCGNKKIDPGEDCDDGNSEDGDGCTKQCKKECSVSVDWVVSDEMEMKKGGSEFAIISSDPIDDSASHCDIEAVSSTKPEPKEKPRNAMGGSIGNPKFSYKRVSSKEITGKLTGLLWYGHGDGAASCIPEFGGTSGDYSFEVTVELKNGTKQTKKSEASIGYGSGAGRADPEVSFWPLIATKKLPGYPKRKAVGWECCVAVEADPSDDLVTISGTVTDEHPTELQYASLVNREEAFHARQLNAEVDWSQGGLKKGGMRLDNDGEVLRRYGLTQVCGRAYLRDKEISCLVAEERAYKEAKKIAGKMNKDLSSWTGVGGSPFRCHVEYTAKKASGLTRDKVGVDYKCGYELPGGCPNPAPVAPYFWEFIGK
jgi:cysteine-rich repeat protein